MSAFSLIAIPLFLCGMIMLLLAATFKKRGFLSSGVALTSSSVVFATLGMTL
ncbi:MULTISPECIES: hypothetical protein [Franconibacter]|uniref:Uncharacterized protein n=1 Tax=Franconibacter daqui TaxID=2047724 RepID=A0ABV1PPL0_9ENTR|nr:MULTISPECIES: hypothetical protein [Franconibacter]GGD07285.1 hypothetical protein GCM10011513_01140 [Franconibacter daqui]